MGIQVKVVPKEDWDVLRKYVNGSGVILIPAELAEKTGVEEQEVEYDFGGDADVWVDIVRDETHHLYDILSEVEAADAVNSSINTRGDE